MFVLGLTGSIGMGKSTAAHHFRRLGIPVFDADRTVARLMAKGGRAVMPIAALFPSAIRGGAVDHAALAKRVFEDHAALRRLEEVLHPMVDEERRVFLQKWRRQRRPLVVLDIPLLYEIGGERLCDGVAVVSAPLPVQRRRVLARPNMTEHRFRAILARQISDREKRRRADFIIPTGLSRAHGFRAVRRIVRDIVFCVK
ncbi:dephospho-CoA kinase [Varunaivibrio sulfuroxidans]|uniref:Dephospho-CoA kinase n=1 Tax=Varunaivibrio sulfuroxidans TaxID=1773489 RepID=A0A4R3JFF3_9PROT|nr:dephospho-CoA kinase [Varunaivibrio sulfuroxidans]TCS64869.1 dephospho-CoA kinase [Varunaivibrio sulfuroxidans]WES29834.1 dephospho-CoA kinase [Varunaivibrio sulfuroxidans]